jgi:hypothetical protein
MIIFVCFLSVNFPLKISIKFALKNQIKNTQISQIKIDLNDIENWGFGALDIGQPPALRF